MEDDFLGSKKITFTAFTGDDVIEQNKDDYLIAIFPTNHAVRLPAEDVAAVKVHDDLDKLIWEDIKSPKEYPYEVTIDPERTYEVYLDDSDSPKYFLGEKVLELFSEARQIEKNQIEQESQSLDENQVDEQSEQLQSEQYEDEEKAEHEQEETEQEQSNAEHEQEEAEQEQSEPATAEKLAIPITVAILAKPYDIALSKLMKLEDKNMKLAEKNDRIAEKLAKTQSFVEHCDAILDSSLFRSIVFPAPFKGIVQILREERNNKATNLENKLNARNAKIERNSKRIDKQQSRMDEYKKINDFLVNLKTPEGRRENYITGLKEFKESSIKKTQVKLDNLQSKIDKTTQQLSSTRFVKEKKDLNDKLERYTAKKDKLTSKLTALEDFDEKLLWVEKASEQDVNAVVDKSCESVVNEFTNNPAAVKNPADSVIETCGKVIDTEEAKAVEREKSTVKVQKRTAASNDKSVFSKNDIKNNSKIIAQTHKPAPSKNKNINKER